MPTHSKEKELVVEIIFKSSRTGQNGEREDCITADLRSVTCQCIMSADFSLASRDFTLCMHLEEKRKAPRHSRHCREAIGKSS